MRNKKKGSLGKDQTQRYNNKIEAKYNPKTCLEFE